MRRILFLSVFAAFLVGFGFGEIQAQLPHTIDLDEGEEDVRILGDDYAGYSGAAVASGDVNGDGIDDIIIGAPNGDTDGRSDEGEVYVIYGKANLPDKIGLGGKVSVRIMGAYEGDEFGASVACGDVNGDGIDDIIIGAPGVDVNDLSDEGAAYVIFGSASLPDTIEVYGWHGSEKGVPGIENNGYVVIWGFYNGGRVGQAVATGDVNGDGVGDIIVGAPGVDVVTDSDEGETYVIFGSASLPSDIYLDSDEDVLIVGNGDEANSGWALASGDVNGDGIDDIIIGAPGADTEVRSEEGKTYVILGSEYALYDETIWLDDDEDVLILGDDEYGHSGSALATGDVNGDGIDDIVIGAPGADTEQPSEEGKTYIILGSEDLGDEIDEIWLDDDEDVVILGDDEGDYSGWA
ncbi:MAG: FG-GAP repeat protein, partial [Gemmatimonadota bacterium]